MSNNGTFSTNLNNKMEALVASNYIDNQNFFPVKGEWANQAEYQEAGLPVYPNNHHRGYKNPCDLVRKNQIVDLKFSQSVYISLSEIVVGSSQRASSCKLGQEADYVVEVVNHDLSRSLRVNVSQLMQHGDFVSGKDTKKVKLYLKRLIPGHFQSGKGGKSAHRQIIKRLQTMGVGTYGKLYREWDL